LIFCVFRVPTVQPLRILHRGADEPL